MSLPVEVRYISEPFKKDVEVGLHVLPNSDCKITKGKLCDFRTMVNEISTTCNTYAQVYEGTSKRGLKFRSRPEFLKTPEFFANASLVVACDKCTAPDPKDSTKTIPGAYLVADRLLPLKRVEEEKTEPKHPQRSHLRRDVIYVQTERGERGHFSDHPWKRD